MTQRLNSHAFQDAHFTHHDLTLQEGKPLLLHDAAVKLLYLHTTEPNTCGTDLTHCVAELIITTAASYGQTMTLDLPDAEASMHHTGVHKQPGGDPQSNWQTTTA